MARLDWEKAHRRDIVRDQGSERVYPEQPRPEKPTKKRKKKGKDASVSKSTARARKKDKPKETAPRRQWNPSPAAQAIMEFRRLPLAERQAQLAAYESRIRAAYREHWQQPLSGSVIRARAQQLARLHELAHPSRNQQAPRSKSKTRSVGGKLRVSVERKAKADTFLVTWTPTSGIERWQVTLTGRRGRETVIGPQRETRATFSGVRRAQGPFTIVVTGLDHDGIVRARGRHSLFPQRQGKRNPPKAKQQKGKSPKPAKKRSISNAAANTGKRSRVRLIS